MQIGQSPTTAPPILIVTLLRQVEVEIANGCMNVIDYFGC
jgi:hypothetical protein